MKALANCRKWLFSLHENLTLEGKKLPGFWPGLPPKWVVLIEFFSYRGSLSLAARVAITSGDGGGEGLNPAPQL
jgi:hypothetical protein